MKLSMRCLVGMLVARLLGAMKVKVKADSKVVVSQVFREFAAKGKKLKKYL